MQKTELKSLIHKINSEPSFAKAEGMLEILNDIFGTKYGFVARRVVRFDDPDFEGIAKYMHVHDVENELN